MCNIIKKILLPLMILLTTAVTVSASETQTSINGFRDCEWGSTKEDILEKEFADKSEPEEGIDYSYAEDTKRLLIFNQTVSNFDTCSVYSFDDDGGLIQGLYVLTEEHTNKTDYYTDYCTLVKVYKDKYGEPYNVDEMWKDDLYKDDPSDWGMAVAVGDVVFRTQWKDNDGNEISIVLFGDNYEIESMIGYDSYEFLTRDKKNDNGV